MTRWFDFTDWERIRRDWSAWWSGELRRPLVTLVARDPGSFMGDDFLTRFPLDMPAEKVIDFFDEDLKHIHFYGDSFPKYWVNFAAGIAAAFLGSPIHYENSTTWFHPLPVASIAGIKPAFDPDNVWWKRCQDITQAAIERWCGRVLVSYTDLGGNLDILASLRGTENLLLDTMDMPEEVERLTREITPLWLRYFNQLESMMPPEQVGRAAWAPHWYPSTGYMLQSDFCYMISPEMFERFVLPDLTACCDALDYPFYHMDGKGQLVHLDALLSIQKLRGIQWQPGDGQPPADGWMDVLRRIRAGGKLCQVYVTLDGARNIVRELGGAGFLFDIFDDGVTTQRDIDAFFEEFGF
jgi:5-methyltetrahydrofolate--homocysteine methyltransferase